MYPLDEGTTVVGFEAAVCRRMVTVQIKDKAKIDDTYFDSCSLPHGRAGDGSGEGIEGVLGNVGRKGGEGEWGGGEGWLAGWCLLWHQGGFFWEAEALWCSCPCQKYQSFPSWKALQLLGSRRCDAGAEAVQRKLMCAAGAALGV